MNQSKYLWIKVSNDERDEILMNQSKYWWTILNIDERE